MLILLISLFVVLQNGLYLDNVSISNIHAKNIYIKWDNKINVSMQELQIDTKKDKTKLTIPFTFKEVSKYIKIISQTTNWFHSIVISSIQIGDTSGSFKYTNDDQGFLVLQSPTLQLKSNIYFHSRFLKILINNFEDKKKSLQGKGIIVFDTDTKRIYTKINLDIHKDANLTIYSMSDSKHLVYNVVSNQNITNISHLIKIAHLPKEVIYCVYTAIKMNYLSINEFHGFINYNDMQNAYKNIHVKASITQLNYTYNPKLDAVHTPQTNLEFKNGILYIRPQNPHSYSMDLGKSWLKIDFSQKEELLTLYLLFDGSLNKDMLHVLNTYKIKLPFLQRKGKVDTNLTITVNLRTIDVNAKGNFYTKKANFDYLGLNIDIYNAHIQLDNYDVLIDKMNAQYKHIAQADVHVRFNAKKAIGTIHLDFNKINSNGLSLITNQQPLHVTYNINPNQDTIDIQASKWKFKTQTISLDKLLVDFNLNTLKANIPIVFFKVGTLASGYMNGVINLKTSKMNFDVDLLKLQYSGIKLSQTTTPLRVQYDKILSVSSSKEIFFTVNGSEYKAKNFSIDFKNESIFLKHTFLEISQYISTKIYANYDFNSKKSHISLSDFILKNPKTGKTLYKNNKILLGGYIDGKNITIDSKELGAIFVLNNDEWRLTLNSIASIAQKSQFLRKYKLDDGEISFYKKSDALYTHFQANILYPYPLLVDKNKEISKYTISGKITKEQKIYLRINKNINVKIDKDVKIKIHDSGLNIDKIIDFTKQIITSNTTAKSDFKLSVDAINSYLYLGNNRYAISDAMHLQYYNNIVTAQLTYRKGNAGFKLQNNTFHLYGKNFDDKFMEKLFVLSKFSGGRLDFSMNGTLDDYQGIFYMNDTNMLDYKLLNNVLAFINTVPSLVTFSLPGYNKKGLHVNNAYVKFHAKKGVFDISDIYLESKEMTILGKGNANVKKNTIDLTLNLKTDLGSNLSKIPLVGYIIFDGKSISTTLKVSGKLNDPTVNTMLAKDIVVAPLNIIKRTLTLPYELLKKLY